MTDPRNSRRLKRVVLWAAGGIALLSGAAIATYLLTLYTAGSPQRGYLALTQATVLVGAELVPRRSATVLIRDGRIVALGNEHEVEVPTEATVLDLQGYTLMPGLIDLHVHLGAPELDEDRPPGRAQLIRMVVDAARFAPGKRRSLLHHGVTTVRSAGDALDWILEVRQQLRAGVLEGPRLYTAGPLFTAPGGHPVVTLFRNDPAAIEQGARLPRTAEEARAAVRPLAQADHAIDFVKVVQDRGGPENPLQSIPLQVLRAIVAEAHQHGLAVVAHWGTQQDLVEVLDAGVDGLEHVGRVLDGWPHGLLAELVDRGVSVTPTLTVVEARLPRYLPIFQQRVADLHAAGVRVVTGSDAGMPGVPFGTALHRELELLVGSGLTPREALQAATSSAASVLRADDLGAIIIGNAADLVVVEGDPLRQIQAIRNVVMVFRDGRLVVDRRGEPRGP